VRACAAQDARCAPDDASLRRQLQRLAESDPDPIVRGTAGRAAGAPGDAAMHTLATLSTMERILFLRRVPLFADLSPADLKQVAAAIGERLHTDGDVIAQEGDPGEELYIITSGAVRVLAGADKAEVARRGPGEYVGEMAIISQEPRMASLVAAGEVRLLSLERAAFEEVLRERPEAGLAVMRVLIARLKEAQAT
jgi:signal-transduction protein with cAMP-binding, CBS, and nucleotidyltransferase domain